MIGLGSFFLVLLPNITSTVARLHLCLLFRIMHILYFRFVSVSLYLTLGPRSRAPISHTSWSRELRRPQTRCAQQKVPACGCDALASSRGPRIQIPHPQYLPPQIYHRGPLTTDIEETALATLLARAAVASRHCICKGQCWRYSHANSRSRGDILGGIDPMSSPHV
jgi:hypothetical protein